MSQNVAAKAPPGAPHAHFSSSAWTVCTRYVALLLAFARAILPLAVAQLIGRLGSLLLASYTGRILGAAQLGQYALGRTLVGYVVICTDMGARDIGVRLVARDPEMAPLLVRAVQRKRLILSALAVAALGTYALLGPVPPGERVLLLCFVLGAAPWCLRLDWLFWGRESFARVSICDALVSAVYVVAAVALMALMGRAPLYGVAAAGALSLLFGAALTRVWWRKQKGSSCATGLAVLPPEVANEIRWWPVLVLGASRICAVLFETIDVMLLGALVAVRELGQYNAAYRILTLVFGVYYLATGVAFPALARIERSRRSRFLITTAIATSATAGIAIALVIHILSRPIVLAIFGPDLASAARLLRVLALAIPFEFAAAFVSTVLIADGRNGVVAAGRLAGLVANVALNLIWIPRSGAMGAAWATVASYAVLVASFLAGALGSRGPLLSTTRREC